MSESWTMAVGFDDTEYTISNESPGHPDPQPWSQLREHPLLRNAVAKAQWGERHLSALSRSIDEFFSDPVNRAVIRADLDAETDQHVFTLAAVPELAVVREEFSLALADVAGNLREAIDQFAWQLACDFAKGDPPNPTAVHFPIRESADEFVRKEKRARRQIRSPALGLHRSLPAVPRLG